MNIAVPVSELSNREVTPQSTSSNVPVNSIPEFSLLVAGCRGGKTSLLRLLLDTCNISPRASRDQLASVAKFVQGCGSHTTHIRSTSIPVDLEAEGGRELTLSLVDTPSLDFKDAAVTERSMLETLRYIEGRLSEAADTDWDQQNRLVHLCVYFLDPDQIIPSSIPAPPAPVVPRTRTNSFSQPDQEPVILEPPVTNNPLLHKPTLPPLDVLCIRRLSARVNVLPVIARADVLPNDRLSAIKMAVRRDLADAGIGFGIFDMEAPYQLPDEIALSKSSDTSNGYGVQSNIATAGASPPTSPNTHSMLRLPYALISPDVYGHSDGVPRLSLSRSDLIQTYTPSQYSHPASKFMRGKFTRIYRWGSLDVLDPSHCDFGHLRSAIFHHMETLQKYTREYLFEKFRVDYKLPPQQQQLLPTSRHSLAHLSSSHSRMPSLGQPSRPVLAIDTAPNRPNTILAPRAMSVGRDIHSAPMSRNVSDNVSVKSNGSTDTTAKGSKQRTKKITVACNFCRSRKLKCDGGRPSCTQCIKRSLPCDYMPQNRRRRGVPRRADEESESESVDDPSDAPSMSPQAASRPHSRRNSIFDKHNEYGSSSLPPITGGDIPSSSRSRGTASSSAFDTELPHIATLSLPDPSPSTPGPPMSAPSLPPIRPASEHQSAQRKRASTVPGKSTRQASHSGPKVVACNFCRARKTKCDGAHPACSSCARRSLSCSYVTDRRSGGDKARRASTSKVAAAAQRPPPTPQLDYIPSPPSSRMAPTPSTGVSDMYERRDVIMADHESDLKRSAEYMDNLRPPKKMRVENNTGIP
ncbi:GTP binding protein [Lentinula aff. detonsa]|uniref:GTP binding protein n=1 Tax=Lentinula aff. detonsa TaxID=2804958 RepID=A0AA38U1L1_9AGAR|nr:GTP binding protein [Lentinula aff. detonsa]